MESAKHSMLLKRALVVASAVAAATALAACSSGSGSGGSSGAAQTASSPAGPAGFSGDYGKCDVSDVKANVIKVKPAVAGTLTVEGILPAPGWYNGTVPKTIKDGYGYCLAAHLAKMAGLKSVTIKNVSFAQLIAGRTNTFDLALAQASITPAREKVVDFSTPYFDSNIGVLVKKGADVTQSNVTSKRCAAYSGTTSVAFIKDTLKCKTTRIYPNNQTLYQGVLSGQTDAAFLDTAVVLAEAKNSGGKLEVVAQYKTGEHYGAIYPKNSPNEDALDKGIKMLKKDGILSKLSKDYLGPAFGGNPGSVPIWTIN